MAQAETRKQRLTLDTFHPAKQAEHITTTLQRNRVLPMEQIAFSVRAVGILAKRYQYHEALAQQYRSQGKIEKAEHEHQQATQWGEDYWNTRPGKKLRERVQTPIYTAIEKVYELAPSGISREQFFRQSMEQADSAYMEIVKRMGDEAIPLVSLLDETRRAREPLDFIRLLTRPDISDKLRFELWRKLTLGTLAAEIAIQSHDAKVGKILARNVGYFDEELFAEQVVGNPQFRELQVLHDIQTNKVLWVEGTHSEEEKAALQPGIFRETQYGFQMRKFDGVGKVMSLPRQKSPEASINKTVVKALERISQGKSSDLDPAEDVQDRSGQKIVVFGARSNNDPLMATTIDAFKAAMATRYGINAKDTAAMTQYFIDDDHHNEGKTQSAVDHTFRRIQFYPPERDSHGRITGRSRYPVEYIFESIVSYIDNEKHTGTLQEFPVRYNGDTYLVNQPNGSAHQLFEDRRAQKLLSAYIVEAIYDPNHELRLVERLLEASLRTQLIHQEELLHPREIRGGSIRRVVK